MNLGDIEGKDRPYDGEDLEIPVHSHNGISFYQPKYKCSKHGNVDKIYMHFKIPFIEIDKKYCVVCYYEFISKNCCELEEVLDDNN